MIKAWRAEMRRKAGSCGGVHDRIVLQMTMYGIVCGVLFGKWALPIALACAVVWLICWVADRDDKPMWEPWP